MEKIQLRKVHKYEKNPFITDEPLIKKHKKQSVAAGKINKVLLDPTTGEIENISMLYGSKEVDQDQFIKLYVDHVAALFELSKTGLKAFAYVLNCMKVNNDLIYINITRMVEFCGWKTTKQAYRGIAELLANKIIAQSVDVNLWFINPNIVFNGDRFAYIREFRKKQPKKELEKQAVLSFSPPTPEGD